MGDKSSDLLKQFDKERKKRDEADRIREEKKRQRDRQLKDEETRFRAKKLEGRTKIVANESKAAQTETDQRRKELLAEANRSREEFWKKLKDKLDRKDELIDSKIKDVMQDIKNSSANQLTDIDSRTDIEIDSSKRKLKESQRNLDEKCEEIIRELKDYVNKRESVIKRTLEDRRLPDHFLGNFITSAIDEGNKGKNKESSKSTSSVGTSSAPDGKKKKIKNKSPKDKSKESAPEAAKSPPTPPPPQPPPPHFYNPYFMPPPGQHQFYYPPPPGYPPPDGQHPPYYPPNFPSPYMKYPQPGPDANGQPQVPPGSPQTPPGSPPVGSPPAAKGQVVPPVKGAAPNFNGQKSPAKSPINEQKPTAPMDKWGQYLETPKQAQIRLANEAREKGLKPKFVPLPSPTVNDGKNDQKSPKNKKNHKHKKHRKDKKRDKK